MILLIVLLPLCNSISEAQSSSDTLRPRYGFFAGVGLNLHSAAFSKLPGVPNCCPKFESGSGFGPLFGLLYETPVADDMLIGFRAGYSNRSGLLSDIEETTVIVNLQPVTGEFEHTIDAGLAVLFLEPTFSYQVSDNLFATIGVAAGTYIQKSFRQKEEIVKPAKTGVFPGTQSRVRNEISGDIDEMTQLDLAVSAGVSYELPLNKDGTLLLAPELKFYYGITNVVSSLDWKISSVSAGVAIKYTPFETIYSMREVFNIDTVEKKTDAYSKKIYINGATSIRTYDIDEGDTVYNVSELSRTDTLMIPVPKKKPIITKKELPEKELPEKTTVEPSPPDLAATLDVFGETNSGDRVPLENIRMEVRMTTEVYPLLPYIFFGKGSAQLPSRYVQLRIGREFVPNKLEPSPIIYHRNNLNIIGSRLIENPNVKLMVKGFADPTTETGDCSIAKSRAESVKAYLVNTFGIDGDRIVAEAGAENCYPPDLTKTKSEDGYAENRRVEFYVNDPSILAPVKGYRYQKPMVISPPMIQFSPKVLSGQFDYWTLNAEQNGYPLEQMQETGKPVRNWHELSFRDAQQLQNGLPLDVEFTVYGNDGESVTINKSFKVIKDTSKIEVESLTLAIFQVSQASLDSRLKSEIRNFVRGLGHDASIMVRGYSDYLGDEDENIELSARRADQVKDYIKSIAPNAKITKTEGIGPKLYPPGVSSYNTPEERFMSRTVEIEIRKKLLRK